MRGLLCSLGGCVRTHDVSHIAVVNFNRPSTGGRIIIDPDYIEVVEAFGYLA